MRRLWFIHPGKKRYLPEMYDLRCDEWVFLKNQLLPVGGATGGLCDGTRVGGESSEGSSPGSHQSEFSCCGGNGRTLQQDREPGIIHLGG